MKLHNEEIHNLYSSSDIIRKIKSRRITWAGHVACMRDERKCTRFWGESPKERRHSKDQGVGGSMGSELGTSEYKYRQLPVKKQSQREN
jgi:hypothetical protein